MRKKVYFLLLPLLFFNGINKVQAASVTNGNYYIKNYSNNSKVLDVSGGYTYNGTNIQLYNSNNSLAQKWNIRLQNDGHYTITSQLDSNKAIDVASGIFQNRTNIQLYNSNFTQAQKWDINHFGRSSFEISTQNRRYCLDIQDGAINNGTNIQLYSCNNTNAQRFKIVEMVEAKQTIADGTYYISSALDNNKVLDVYGGNTNNKTNIQLYQFNNTNAQMWRVKYLNNGYYSITSKLNRSKCMDVDNGSSISQTNVQLYNCNNTNAQQFIIRDLGDGYYGIFTKNDPIPLDINNASTNNSTNIQIFYNNGSKAQKFKFNKVEEKTIDTGVYTIRSMVNNNQVLDVQGGVSNNGVNVQSYRFNNTNSQIWYVNKTSDGFYNIRSGLNSALYLGVNGTNVQLSTNEFKWDLVMQGNNTAYVIDKNSGLYLNLNNGSSQNGANINLVTNPQNNAQLFYFEDTNINSGSPTINNGYYSINSVLNTSKVIDVSGGSKINKTNIQLYNSNGSNAQIWYFKYLNNGYYSITSAMNPAISLDLDNGNISSGTNIQLYKANGTDAQMWKIRDDGVGHLSFVSKKANICVSVLNSNASNGANIQANNCIGDNSQKFIVSLNNKTKVYTGIDVSQYQGNINWAAVASSNIGFVMLRGGIGDNLSRQDDKKFTTYVKELEKYNIPYGVYIYSYAKQANGPTGLNVDSESAASEAAHALRLVNNSSYKPNLKKSIFIDIEDDSMKNFGKTRLTAIADKFCSTVQNSGYGCGMYASTSWYRNNLDTVNLARKYGVWVAEWTRSSSKATHSQAMSLKPSYNITSYNYWQFSSSGSIRGINGNVDLDMGYNIFD